MEDINTDVAADPFALVKSMGLNLSPWYLLGGFVFGVVGFYYWREGRKRHYRRTLWVGVALMAYPIIVYSTFLVWCVGIFLWSLAYYFKSEGQ